MVAKGEKMPTWKSHRRIYRRKTRVCLMCGNPFDSTGPGNRRCPKCSDTHHHVIEHNGCREGREPNFGGHHLD